MNKTAKILKELLLTKYLAHGLIIPYLPILAEDKINISTVGICASIGVLFVLLTQPIIGHSSDRLGFLRAYHVSLLLLGVLAVGLLSSNLYVVIPAYIGVVALSRISNNIIDGAAGAYQAQHFGNVRKWGSIGYAISLLAGSFLLKYGHTASITFFILLLIMSFIFSIKHTGYFRDIVNRNGKNGLNLNDFSSSFFILICAIAICSSAINVSETYFSFIMKQLGMNSELIGVALFAELLAEIIAFQFFSSASKYNNNTIIMIMVGMFLYLIRYLLIIYWSDIYIVVVAQLLAGAGFSIFYTGCVSIIKLNSPEHRIHFAQAMRSTAVMLSLIVGNTAGGYLISIYGGELFFEMCATLCVLAIALLVILLVSGIGQKQQQVN